MKSNWSSCFIKVHFYLCKVESLIDCLAIMNDMYRDQGDKHTQKKKSSNLKKKWRRIIPLWISQLSSAIVQKSNLTHKISENRMNKLLFFISTCNTFVFIKMLEHKSSSTFIEYSLNESFIRNRSNSLRNVVLGRDMASIAGLSGESLEVESD